MTTESRVTLLQKDGGSWEAGIDRLRMLLGAPNNPALFPPHYLKATFPRIGGKVAVVERDRMVVGVGFLFPRSFQASARVFTLRFHRTVPEGEIDRSWLMDQVEQLIAPDRAVTYDPLEPQHYQRTSWRIDGIEVGRPDEAEAREIRHLQQEIWGSGTDFLYPTDIHSVEFGIGSSLVARVEGRAVGFLFGLYRFGTPGIPNPWDERYRGDLSLESQLLAVLPGHAGSGIGSVLKRAQAELARQEGIQIVNWTVDPLQFRNALLNFDRLGAIAFDFHPRYYAFENALNQVAASRLGITWLVDSPRVKQATAGHSNAAALSLGADDGIQRVNDGWSVLDLESESRAIAIEVPADWTGVQRRDVRQAQQWREGTDRIFERYLGSEEGRYIITHAGQDGSRRFLVAERVDAGLLERLAGRPMP